MKSPNDKDLRTMFAPVRGARRGTTNVALNIQWPGDDPVSEMDFYAEAYHRAGRKLFDAIPKNDDYWFFSFDACPIIFLYWHALELHLKDAGSRSATCCSTPVQRCRWRRTRSSTTS